MLPPRPTIPLVLLVVVVASAMVGISSAIDHSTVAPVALPSSDPDGDTTGLSSAQEKALDIALEANKLIASLALLLFTAVGFLIRGKEGFAVHTTLRQMLLALVLSSASIALYLSYVVYDAIIAMLDSDFLALGARSVLVPRNLQIYSLLLAVISLGCLFLICLNDRRTPEE